MNREDVIRMAREAGFDIGGDQHIYNPYTSDHSELDKELERFAALIAATEREACAKVCEGLPNPEYSGYGEDGKGFADAIRARTASADS